MAYADFKSYIQSLNAPAEGMKPAEVARECDSCMLRLSS